MRYTMSPYGLLREERGLRSQPRAFMTGRKSRLVSDETNPLLRLIRAKTREKT